MFRGEEKIDFFLFKVISVNRIYGCVLIVVVFIGVVIIMGVCFLLEIF